MNIELIGIRLQVLKTVIGWDAAANPTEVADQKGVILYLSKGISDAIAGRTAQY